MTYSWSCADIEQNDHGLFVASMVYIYHIIKIVDLLDTVRFLQTFLIYIFDSNFILQVFFVLRKKQNQVTFLHVYHHFGMVALSFLGCKFVPGGHSIFMGYINSIVHVVMYFYYLLTAYDKKFKKHIWFKRKITEMQLVRVLILQI